MVVAVMISALKPLGARASILWAVFPAIAMGGALAIGPESICRYIGGHRAIAWFLLVGLGVFLPMLIVAVVMAAKDCSTPSLDSMVQRLRLERLSPREGAITIAAIVFIMVLGGGVVLLGERIIPGYSPMPAIGDMPVLGPGEYWVLGAWFPFFLLNILGEELYWRGYLMPRQQAWSPGRGWWLHALCWLLFHLPLGLNMVLFVIPTIGIQTIVVWHLKKTWSGIIIHGVLGGAGFIAVALGLYAR